MGYDRRLSGACLQRTSEGKGFWAHKKQKCPERSGDLPSVGLTWGVPQYCFIEWIASNNKRWTFELIFFFFFNQWLTSHQETDGSAHSGTRSKQHHLSLNTWFNWHSPKALSHRFRKQHGHLPCSHFCLLSEKACLHAGADWLSSSVRRRVARGQFTVVTVHAALCDWFHEW